jgi:hypothetical protein
MLLLAFWLAQACILWLVQGFLYITQTGVDAAGGAIAGELPTPEDYLDLITSGSFAVWMGGSLLVLTAAQAIFVWPLRRPGVSPGRGKSARASLVISGLAIAWLGLAWLLGVSGFAEEVLGVGAMPFAAFLGVGDVRFFVATLLVGWLVATPLVIAFSRPGPREDLLSRVSRRILAGTVIEVALLIPLDVMLRRKTSCYCAAGTYWGLTICGFVGVFAVGPAVFLPLLAKRRRPWYGGRCGVCGYDMTGRLDAPRCPECGTGWRVVPGERRAASSTGRAEGSGAEAGPSRSIGG